MKHICVSILLFLVHCITQAQVPDSIYTFMNNELPALPIAKSNWGIFFLQQPYILDDLIYQKFLKYDLLKIPENIREEFVKSCFDLKSNSQNNLFWNQEKLQNLMIVRNTKKNLPVLLSEQIHSTTGRENNITYWIKEWNTSTPGERLVNYASIPVFSLDKNYVFIIRGQDVPDEGGWDSIFIYKKENGQWITADEIILSSI